MKPLCLIFLMLYLMVFHGMKASAHSEESEMTAVTWFTYDSFFRPYAEANDIDTTLTGFQRYDYSYRESLFFAGKANVGHVARLLVFDPVFYKERSGFPATPDYPGYLLTQSGQRFYRPEHVFSELNYVLGSEREQLFYAMHNQRLHESVYAGVMYQTVNSPGVYSRMGARNAAIELKLDAELGDHYGFLSSFVVNRLINRESGGLKNHLHFEEDEVRDSVFLYTAESRYRDVGVRMHQYYNIRGERMDDTLQESKTFNPGVFHHEFSYKRRAWIFDEKAAPYPGFYDVRPNNPEFTFDSTLVHTLSNKLSWSNHIRLHGHASLPLFLNVSLEHAMVTVRQPVYLFTEEFEVYSYEKNSLSQYVYRAEAATDPGRFLSFDAGMHYVSGGYNDKDLGVKTRLMVGGSENAYRLNLAAAYKEEQAPWFMHNFRGNYISWDNDFSKSRVTFVGADFLNPYINLEAGYYRLHKPVFMNAQALPEQHPGSLSLVKAGVSAAFRAGAFRSYHKLYYQYTGEEHFERFPEWLSYHSLYADVVLFDNALHAHAGFDLTWNAPYKPMAYMPVIRQFYIQDDYESGHVLKLDAFVNARISRARLFVKLENILGLMFDMPQYYDIPFYPVPENMFKFGVSWMFFD
ncbi:MAG: putative porin [Bacteroidales bacterium]|nr:putative porin [Bacteroidales bacterium]